MLLVKTREPGGGLTSVPRGTAVVNSNLGTGSSNARLDDRKDPVLPAQDWCVRAHECGGGSSARTRARGAHARSAGGRAGAATAPQASQQVVSKVVVPLKIY